jgi:hypothetical protein
MIEEKYLLRRWKQKTEISILKLSFQRIFVESYLKAISLCALHKNINSRFSEHQRSVAKQNTEIAINILYKFPQIHETLFLPIHISNLFESQLGLVAVLVVV